MRRIGLLVMLVVGCSGSDPESSSTSQGLTGENGIWENGLATNGIWENGIWENGIWENGIWENGIWENGIWENGIWENGIWENGIWENGIWENGIWENGIWENGIWENSLQAQTILANNPYAGKLLQYIYGCAMPPGAHKTLDAGNSITVELDGGIGLWPTWAAGVGGTSCDATCQTRTAAWQAAMAADNINVEADTCDESCQRWVSACVLARTNAYGVPVQISMRAPANAPMAIKNVLATSPEEEAEFPLREGAFYGNLFQTHPDPNNGNVLVNNPVLYACAGPGSNIPDITKRFCSSQGASGVITNTGLCEPAPNHTNACASSIGATEASCYGPPSGLVPDKIYDEVITTYIKQPLAVCGNSVCEAGEHALEPNACPSDCHPGTWARAFDQIEILNLNANIPPLQTTATISPVDNSVVAVGWAHTTSVFDVGNGPTDDSGMSPSNELVLVKYDAAGAYQWSHRIPVTGEPRPASIAVSSTGEIAVLASNAFSVPNRVWVAKFSSDGAMLPDWPRTYGGSAQVHLVHASGHQHAGQIKFDPSGNLIIAGRYQGQATFGSTTFTSQGYDPNVPCCFHENVFIAKLSPVGLVQWAATRAFEGGLGTIAIDSTGDIIIPLKQPGNVNTGYLDKIQGEDGGFTAFPWPRIIPNSTTIGVAIDPVTNDVFLTGQMVASFNFGGSIGDAPSTSLFGAEVYLVKYNTAGFHQWSKLSGAGGSNTSIAGSHLALSPAGDVILAGEILTNFPYTVDFGQGAVMSYGFADTFVAGFDKDDGAIQWSKLIPMVLIGFAEWMGVGNDGDVVMAGFFNGSMNFDDQLLINGVPELTDHDNMYLASFKPPSLTDDIEPVAANTPETIVKEATNSWGAKVWFMPPTATDTGNAGVSVNCVPAPDVAYPIGTTLVTCTATDPLGNDTTTQFNVVVHDTLPPIITGLAPVDATTNSPSGTAVTYADPTSRDQVDGLTHDVSCAPASGSVFPVGTTTVSCTATDTSGNTATRTFPVTVTNVWPSSPYTYSGVLQPINQDNSSVFKLGSTIPIKFKLTGGWAGYPNLVAELGIAKLSNNVFSPLNEVVSSSAADSGTTFRYDPIGDLYIFNWSTKSPLTAGVYQITITLDDGQVFTVQLGLKK